MSKKKDVLPFTVTVEGAINGIWYEVGAPIRLTKTQSKYLMHRLKPERLNKAKKVPAKK